MADLTTVWQAGRHLRHESRRKRDPPAHRRPRAGSPAALVPGRQAHRFLFEPQRDLPDLDHQPRRERSPPTHVCSPRALSGLVARWRAPGLHRTHRRSIHGSGQTLESTDAENRPPFPESGVYFESRSWSPDGSKLAGTLRRAGGDVAGIATFSLASQKYERLVVGDYPVWLNDSRRLLFTGGRKILLIDSQTKKVTEILSLEPNSVGGLAVSRDNRTVYYGLTTTEGDIWLAELH